LDLSLKQAGWVGNRWIDECRPGQNTRYPLPVPELPEPEPELPEPEVPDPKFG
jgi:hypothetical protein